MRALPERGRARGTLPRTCEGFVVEMEWRDSRNLVHPWVMLFKESADCPYRAQDLSLPKERASAFLGSGE